jgi:hypothetical protein
MVRTALWITAAVLIGVYVAIAFATVDHSSDQAQVDALIARGIAATQSRDVTTMVSCISPNYKGDALNYDQVRMVLAQALRNESDYTVSVSDQTSPEIDGDHATIELHVKLKHAGGATFYDRKMTLELAKEDDRHMLVAPVKTWKVIGSENTGLNVMGTDLQ